MGLFSRFFVQALPCTAEGTVRRGLGHEIVSASRLRDESIQFQHIMLEVFVIPRASA